MTNNKGTFCPKKHTVKFCQEGYCSECQLAKEDKIDGQEKEKDADKPKISL